MNVDSQNSDVIFANFNQDLSNLTVGRRNGFSIYSLNSLDTSAELEEVYHDDTEEMYLVQSLCSTDLLALVSAANRCRLCLFQYRRRKEIFRQTYLSVIVAIQMNLQRLVVLLENSISVLGINDMNHLHTIQDCPLNKHSVSALCRDGDHSYLAYPGSSLWGEINVFDTVYLKSISVIQAHNSPVVAVTFNSVGNLIATASEKGTVIRVFSVLNGQKLHEFRRGVKRCASISSLHFFNSDYLSCSSNTQTIHVFKLDSENQENTAKTKTVGWMEYLGRAVRTSAGYLSTQAAEMLNQGRDFAYAHLPFAGWKSFSAIMSINDKMLLLVATQDGILYVFGVEPETGGLCKLLQKHRLLEPVPLPVSSQLEDDGSEHKNGLPISTSLPIQSASSGMDQAFVSVPRQSYASVVKKKRDGQ